MRLIKRNHHPWAAPLGAGLAGSMSLTLLNESLRKLLPESPRLDVLGMRALARAFRGAHHEPPRDSRFRLWALLGDVMFNSLLFGLALAGRRRRALARGVATGALGGLAAVLAAPQLGMTAQQGVRKGKLIGMLALYCAAGAAAGAVAGRLER